MGTTGLIYVAIVAAWAAYLVPMLLRRSDEVIRRNSAEQYSSANARVLSRQSGDQATPRYVVKRPVAPGFVVPPVAGESVPAGTAVPSSVLLPTGVAVPPGAAVASGAHGPPGPERVRYVPNRARRVAAMRRRRVLSILTLSLLSVTALASFAMLPWWSLAIPATLIVAFVVATRIQLRRQARQRAEERARRRAEEAAIHDHGPGAPVPVEVEETVEIALPVEPDPVRQPAAVAPDPPAEGLWDPVPVTLPTYVLKEKAPDRTVRTISLSGPEVFSSARAADVEPEVEPAPVVPDPAQADEEPEELEIRRAVGD